MNVFCCRPKVFDFIAKRNPTPRMFCDICDEFDQHETEDCQLQASDDLQTANYSQDSNKRVLPEPRKYCESCEGTLSIALVESFLILFNSGTAFGHETAECDDECY